MMGRIPPGELTDKIGVSMHRSAVPSSKLPLRCLLTVAFSLAAMSVELPPSAGATVAPIGGSPETGGGSSPGGAQIPEIEEGTADAFSRPELLKPWLAPAYAPDELLVQFRPTATPSDRSRAAREEGATLLREITPDGLVKFRLRPGDRVEDAIDRWNRLPEVEYATADLRGHAFFVPNDSLIQDATTNWDWNLERADVYGAWDVQTGDPRVILAIIDSGAAYEDHEVPDYEKANLWPGVTMYRRSPELSGPFLPGWDFVNDDPYADDDYGHGTQVATIAAGQANNIAGSAGIAFGVAIMPIKVLDYQGDSNISYFVSGIRFAADHGADVANMSFGFPPLSFFRYVLGVPENVLAHTFKPLQDAVVYAQRRGVILVAAAGNFDAPEVSPPASYPGVIAVGATRPDDRRSSYSSYGRDLDFVAPGGDFTTLVPGLPQDQIFNYSIKPDRSAGSRAKPDSFGVFPFVGTSAASPHVAGAVALLLSKGYQSQGAIEQVLRETAVVPAGKATGVNIEYGNGLVQIGAALRAAGPKGGRGSASAVGSEAAPAARLVSGNPAREGAAFSFRVPRGGHVRVRVFDVRGALVRTVEDRVAPAGEMVARWDGRSENGGSAGAGIYFFRIETPAGVETHKLALVR